MGNYANENACEIFYDNGSGHGGGVEITGWAGDLATGEGSDDGSGYSHFDWEDPAGDADGTGQGGGKEPLMIVF